MRKLIGFIENLPAVFIKHFNSFFLSEGRKDIGVVFIYLLVLIFFFAKTFSTTYMHGDFIAYIVPHYKFILDSIRDGFLPLWQPFSFLGLPEFFKTDLGLFHPSTWLLFIFNLMFNKSMDLTFLGKSIEILQYFNFLMGAIGMYLVLRKSIKVSILPALFGGVVFSLSFYMTIQAGDLVSLPGKLYFPWLVFIVYRFLTKSTFKNYLFLVLVNYLLFAFGYPYYYVYFFFVQIGLALFYGYKKIFGVLTGFINSALIASFFLLPNLHILNKSFRGIVSTIDDPLFHIRNAYIPTKIINIFDPQVFANIYDSRDPHLLFSLGMLSWGVIPLIFLVLGFANLKKTKLNVWLCLIFVFGMLISLGGYLNIPQSLGIIFPIIEKFRTHTQILILTFFAGVVILSQGIESIMKGKYNKIILIFFWEVVLFLLIYLITLPFNCQKCTEQSSDIIVGLYRSTILLILGLLLIQLTLRFKNKIFIIACLIITLLEFMFYSQNIPYLRMKTSYADYYRPNSLILEYPTKDNLFRYSFSENQFIYNTSFLGIFNQQGYEAVPYQAFYSLNRFNEEKILQFVNTKYVVTTQPNKDKDISSLKLIKTVDPRQQSQEVFYGTVNGLAYFSPQVDNKYYIYEEKNYLPRFFVPAKVETCSDISCYSREDPKIISYTKEEGINIANPAKGRVKIKVTLYKPNNITLSIETPAKTFISSSEIWDKGWKIKINGKESKVFNVSDGFRGFMVEAGNSTIDMYYTVPLLLEGTIFTFFGLILLFIVYRINRIKRKRHID